MPSPPDSPSPRERILGAASAVFAEVGFAGARVDEIARRAGINKAMLYYHVGDKRDLYSEVLKRNFGRIEKALEEHLPDEGSAADRLRAVITIVERAITANPDHPRIVLREFASGAANLPAEVLRRMLGLLAVVGEILAEGFAVMRLHAHLEDSLDLMVENVAGETVLGDDVTEDSSEFGHALEDLRAVAETGEHVGSG